MNAPSITEVTGIYGVKDRDLHHGYAEIIICSPTGRVRMTCNPDTDELVLVQMANSDVIGDPIISGTHRVEWMWCLRNQQGYEDGFRVQVAAEKTTRILEFIAIASAVQVFEAYERPNKPLAATR